MVLKDTGEGVGWAVVNVHRVRHLFAAAVPRSGETLEEQTHDALRTIEAVIESENSHGAIVHQAVFLRDAHEMETCRQILKDFYKGEMPATSYVLQPPCDGKRVSIEALGVGRVDRDVEVHRFCEQLVVTSHSGLSWVHCGSILPDPNAVGIYDRSLSAFRRMKALLDKAGVGFEQVVRTWLYLGDIVGPEGETQRYKELNRARTDFFEDIHFSVRNAPIDLGRPMYPASTGIGTGSRDILMSCIALTGSHPGLRVIPLENPQQTAAADYEPVYSLKSPKFARAMAVVAGTCATIFVSGTASILQSTTMWDNDMEGQTWQTIDNIRALISEENLAAHGLPGLGATLDDLAIVRVYVKRQEDYKVAKDVCDVRLGEVPTIFAIADVCRPDLLVEIEAIAFSHRSIYT